MARIRLDKLIEAWEPYLQKAFLEAVRKLRDRVQIGLIAEMLNRGDLQGAIRAVGLDPAAFRTFDIAVQQAYEAGGVDAVEKIPALRQQDGHKLQVLFDVRNPRAEMWLKDHSSTMIRDLVADQAEVIRDHLLAGLEEGRNPRDVALDLAGRVSSATGKRVGGVIGLTASQERWVRNYADELKRGDPNALTRALRDKRFDASVRKAIESGKPLPADLRETIITAYRNRALRYRAETIARTEAMTALGQAQQEAMRQAIDKGQVSATAVTKIWRTAHDKRVRHTHAEMDGQEVRFDQTFESPSGARLLFPGDPSAPAAEIINCRCWSEHKVDFLAGVT